MIIIANTTPTIPFQVTDENDAPVDISGVAEIEISFRQGITQPYPVLVTKTKTGGEVTVSGTDNNICAATFSQEDTVDLVRGQAWVQCRIKASSGEVLSELTESVWIGESLSKEVL